MRAGLATHSHNAGTRLYRFTVRTVYSLNTLSQIHCANHKAGNWTLAAKWSFAPAIRRNQVRPRTQTNSRPNALEKRYSDP